MTREQVIKQARELGLTTQYSIAKALGYSYPYVYVLLKGKGSITAHVPDKFCRVWTRFVALRSQYPYYVISSTPLSLEVIHFFLKETGIAVGDFADLAKIGSLSGILAGKKRITAYKERMLKMGMYEVLARREREAKARFQ